jgi:hypothetical protein
MGALNVLTLLWSVPVRTEPRLPPAILLAVQKEVAVAAFVSPTVAVTGFSMWENSAMMAMPNPAMVAGTIARRLRFAETQSSIRVSRVTTAIPIQ